MLWCCGLSKHSYTDMSFKYFFDLLGCGCLLNLWLDYKQLLKLHITLLSIGKSIIIYRYNNNCSERFFFNISPVNVYSGTSDFMNLSTGFFVSATSKRSTQFYNWWSTWTLWLQVFERMQLKVTNTSLNKCNKQRTMRRKGKWGPAAQTAQNE